MAETEVRVKWLEGSLSLGLAVFPSLTIDRLESVGGTEAGFRASELLLLSLGGCLSNTLAGAAKARDLTLSKVDIQVVGKNVQNPDRFGALEIEIELAANNIEGIELNDTELDKLLEIAEKGCFVTNTLRPGLPITIRRIGAVA